MKVRLLFLQSVPGFVGMNGRYGPFEPGDTYTFDSEPFVDVLVYRGFATRIPLSSERPRPQRASVQSDLSRWLG